MTSDCIYLAPSVFACPPLSHTAVYSEILEQYICHLTHLQDRLNSEVVQLLVGQGVADILVEADCYPIYPSLRDGLARANLDETYQAGDIVKIIDHLLREAQIIEDVLGINAILIDPIHVESPMAYVSEGPQFERQNYQLGTLALGMFLNLFPSNRTWIVGRSVNYNDNTERLHSVRVSATIQDVDWHTFPVNLVFPLTIDEHFPFRESVQQILQCLDLHLLNVDLTSECMTELISFSLMQSEYTGNHEPVIEWSIGSQFSESVLRLHLDKNSTVLKSLLQACVNVICGISMDKTHPLRTGSGGNCKQLKNGAAAAWRRDVDYEFHLHYWSVGDKCVFASCVTHNTFSIPDLA